jgi:hypothetical protein
MDRKKNEGKKLYKKWIIKEKRNIVKIIEEIK